MSHKLKGLGVSVVAALALCLFSTSIAAAGAFTASSYPAFYERTANPSAYGSITTEAGSIECSSGTATGTLNAASTTISIGGSVSECKAFGFAATVNSNGCTTLVHVTSGSGDTHAGTADLVCPAGESIVTTAGPCQTKVHPQNGIATVEMINNTAKGTVEVKLKSTNAKYTVTQDGFLCPFNGTGEKTAGASQTKTVIVSVPGASVSVS